MRIKKQTNGFTLIELMIAMVVIGIGLAITVPAMRDFTAANRQTEQINRFVRDLTYAKSEAITRGRRITLTSTGGATWSNGWNITDNAAAETLRTTPAFTIAGLTLVSTGGIGVLNFRPDGTIIASFTADLCDADTGVVDRDKQVTVSVTGRVSLISQYDGC